MGYSVITFEVSHSRDQQQLGMESLAKKIDTVALLTLFKKLNSRDGCFNQL